MDWSKAKNLIIGMLVIVNVFLLAICFYVESNVRQLAEKAITDTVNYLESRGTSIDRDIIPRTSPNRSILVLERSYDAEASAAKALIGGQEISRKGGIVRFSSELGNTSALWRSGGVFEASAVAAGSSDYSISDDTSLHPAVALLNTSGFLVTKARYAPSDSGLTQIEALEYYAGEPIFNAQLTITCGSNDTIYIAGRWCLGSFIPLSSSKEMEITGLLLRYTEQMNNLGNKITRIDSLESGYIAQSMGNIGVKLIPVWKITSGGIVSYISSIDASILMIQ